MDGVFGSGTAAAVRAFQRKYGLTVDGVVGQTLGLTPRSLHEPSKEQIIAVFAAAS